MPGNADGPAPEAEPRPLQESVAKTASSVSAAVAAGGRLLSIDAMRGLVIAAMIFMDHPASRNSVPVYVIDSVWSGLTFADLVFPSFLFIVGVSMAISFTRKAKAPTREVVLKFLWRILALLVIGLAANWYRYGLPLRYTGVLQRIALASLLAFPLIRRPWKERLYWAAGLILVHAAVVLFVPGPTGIAGIAGGITPSQTVVGSIDRLLVGASHLYRAGFDPEGPFGLLTSAAQVLIGSVVGERLLKHRDEPRMPFQLAAAGAAALVAGMVFSFLLPVNKHLWTGTFVLVTCGLDTIVLAAFFQLADRMRWRRGFEPFVPLGMNALAIYVGSILLAAWLARYMVTLPSGTVLSAYNLIAGGFQAAFGVRRGSYAFSALGVTLWYAIAAALYQARVFIKL